MLGEGSTKSGPPIRLGLAVAPLPPDTLRTVAVVDGPKGLATGPMTDPGVTCDPQVAPGNPGPNLKYVTTSGTYSNIAQADISKVEIKYYKPGPNGSLVFVSSSNATITASGYTSSNVSLDVGVRHTVITTVFQKSTKPDEPDEEVAWATKPITP